MKNDLFRFSLDADIVKSEEGPDERRLIRGYASTASEDRQGETLVQKGLDISDFVEHGWFNYDHDNSVIMGYPLDQCRVDDHGFWVEGELLKGIPQADRIWELAKALKKSNAPRRVGFSVEGKVLEREGSLIRKAKIYNVAITVNPVNTTCSWEAIVKSFSGTGNPTMVDTLVNKSLEAGHETNPLDTEGGGVFRKESLETSLHNLSYVTDDEEKKNILKQELSSKKTPLTKSELSLYLHLTQGWSRGECESFIREHIK